MKNIAIKTMTALFIMSMALFAFGQESEFSQEQINRKHVDQFMLFDQLDLSVDQKAALWDLNAEMNKVKGKSKRKGSIDNLKAERVKIKKEHQDKLNSILTIEQQEELVSLKEEKRQDLKDKRDKRHDIRIAQKEEIEKYKTLNIEPVMSEKRSIFESSLTTDEKAIISSIRAKIEEEKAVRKEEKNDKKRKNFKEREVGNRDESVLSENREALKAIVENHKEELEKIWLETAVQREQWEKDIKLIQEKNPLNKNGKQEKYKKKSKDRAKGKKGYVPFLLMDVK